MSDSRQRRRMGSIESSIDRVGCQGAGVILVHCHQCGNQVIGTGMTGGEFVSLVFMAARQPGHQRVEEEREYRRHQDEQQQR